MADNATVPQQTVTAKRESTASQQNASRTKRFKYGF